VATTLWVDDSLEKRGRPEIDHDIVADLQRQVC
jgi:hypothetical protein